MNAHGTTSKTHGLDSIHGSAAHSHPFGEMPLRAVTKAAVFLPLQIFKKGLEPPWCRFVQLMAAKNDRIFCCIFFAYFSHIFAYFDFPLPRIIPPVHTVVRRAIRQCVVPVWEKQALCQAVRIVRTNPHIVRHIFESHAIKLHKATETLVCSCNTALDTLGDRLVDGHVALTPVLVTYLNRQLARPNDSLPLPGRVARAHAVKAVRKTCERLQIPCLDYRRPP